MKTRNPSVRRLAAHLLTLVAAICWSAGASADTVQLGPQKDNVLLEPFSPNFDIRSNGQGPSTITGNTNLGFAKRSAFMFDIAGNIPAGSTIDGVTLTVFVNQAGSLDVRTMDLHRLTADWGEGASNTGNAQQGQGEPAAPGDVTWLHTFFPDQLWTAAGGDFVAAPSGSTQMGGTGSYTFASTAGLVADVQSWLDAPAGNYGWIMVGDELNDNTTKRMASRENVNVAQRPLLVVDYTPQQPLGACCDGESCSLVTAADCALAGGAYEGDGTSCAPNPCVEPFGACCDSGGSCSEVTEATCIAAGSTFRGDGSTCGSPGCPIQLTPFVDPLPIPAVAVPVAGQSGGAATYDIEMREFQQTLHSELGPTTLWGYDDGFAGPRVPGPTIEARSDLAVTVNWINDLAEFQGGAPRTDHYLDVDTQCIHGAEDLPKSVVHLHGAHVEAEFDGYPEDTYLPGNSDQYVYGNGQTASTLWYHDHALGITRLNVYMGLAGMYNVRDATEDALGLPSGDYEIPLALMDRTFNPDGSLYYPSGWQDHFFGEMILVNGKVWPYLDVDRGKYRFRVLNASGSRFYTLSLVPPAGDLDFSVIGTEGGLLEAPAPVSELTLGPGERYDIVVDFQGLNPGDEVLLENRAGAPFPNGANDVSDVMKFVVGGATGDTTSLPSNLGTVVPIPETESVTTRDFHLAREANDGCGRQNWAINGLGWDDIVEYPELGTVEIWRFINDSGVAHPMHMHLVFFQILDRDGVAPAPEETGWKDTAIVRPGETVRVIARFEDFKGKFAYHCHILEHEDHEMMRQFQTVDCGDGELDPTEICDSDRGALGDGCSESCTAEERVDFAGIASGGGNVQVVIAGQTITLPTVAGRTAAQVAAGLAALINANPTLQSLGIIASSAGDRLFTDGDLTSVLVNDGGLETRMLLLVDRHRLWWSNLGGATAYEVVHGDVNRLSAVGDLSDPLTTTGCLADDLAESWIATQEPEAGEGYWYLVRELPGGSFDTGAPSQSAPRDGAIAGSGNACP